jgi:hypothetical protein
MENLAGYVATGTTSLAVGALLIHLQPKARLVFWSPHTFLFDLKREKVVLQTDALTIQNLGRKAACNVEVILQVKPDFYEFSPAITHEGVQQDNGNYAIKIKELGPKEFVTVQLLSYSQVPRLLNIRSDAGQAHAIRFQFQRVFPWWLNSAAIVVFAIGVGTTAYWLIRISLALWLCVSGYHP